MQIGESDSFWAHWSNIEWVVAGVVASGIAIAGFVWRLSVKVALLEHMVRINDEDEERRHSENVNLTRGLQTRIDALSYRIDRWFGLRSGTRDDN